MFDNLRLNTKLIGSTVGVALMAGLLAWASMNGLDAAQDQLKVLFGQSQKQRLAAEVDSNFQLAISKAKNFCILKDDGNRDKAAKYYSALQASYKELLPLASTPEEKQIFEKIGTGIATVEPHLLKLLSTAKASDKAEDLYEANLKGITAQFDEAIGGYVTALDEKTGQELAARIRRTELTLVLCLVLVVAGLAVSLAVSLGVSKSLEQMISALNEGVDQVAAGSNQVAGSSQQLAEGASEAASSLEETSSSMEEMSSMTRQNSENAARANTLMEETRALVGKGSDAVEGTLKSMSEMNESAEKVSRIIKTIEEIAFQTNLLALNAAVEAARAGEHGRGFAVVAEEVRNLASRSAAAARDTAALIEENARRAGAGMQVSSEAGRSLREIVESSSKVASLVGEIAAASKEQSRGIGEINGAVSQMDKVTQRVTANAEELSSASEEMSGQAVSLRDMVRRLVRMVEGSSADLTVKQTYSAPKTVHQAPAFKPVRNGNGNGGHSKPLTLGRSAEHDSVLPLGLAELRQF